MNTTSAGAIAVISWLAGAFLTLGLSSYGGYWFIIPAGLIFGSQLDRRSFVSSYGFMFAVDTVLLGAVIFLLARLFGVLRRKRARILSAK